MCGVKLVWFILVEKSGCDVKWFNLDNRDSSGVLGPETGRGG